MSDDQKPRLLTVPSAMAGAYLDEATKVSLKIGHFMGLYDDLMGFYGDLIGFYDDFMGFYGDLMGFHCDK